jgi:hypothetical protein
MKKSLVGILAVLGFAAVSSISTQGCSGGGTDGGSGSDIQACNADSDCSSYGGSLGGLCNTTAHVCMQKCSSISDCPATDNSCTAYTPPGGTAVSGQVCSAGTGCVAPALPNTLDGLCETACSSMAGCTGYSTASPRECTGGLCLPTVADAGPCAGVMCPTGQTPDPTMACACTGGNTCTTAGDCTGSNLGDACESGACTLVMCETPPAYSYTAGSGPVIFGTTSMGTISDPDSADGQPCETGGGTVTQYQTNVYFPAGDGPLTSSSGNAYKAVFAVSTGGALLGNTYFGVSFAADSFTWQECIGGSAATGVPAAIAIEDENSVYSNNDCVPQ